MQAYCFRFYFLFVTVFILAGMVRHICVLQLPDSLSVEDVFCGFCIHSQHWLHLVSKISQQRHDFPLDSDAPNAAAYSSASALLFAMTFCFRVYAFMVCPPSIRTPALDDLRVSLQPAQCESVNTVSSSAIFHIQTLVPTVSHVSDTWQAFSTWRDSVGWDSTSSGTIRSRRMLCLLGLD